MDEMAFRDFRQIQEEQETTVSQEMYHRLFFPQLQADADPVSKPQDARFDLQAQPRQPVNSEESKKAEEMETAKEAGAIDSGDSCPVLWPGMRLYDDRGNFVGELRQLKKSFSQRDRKRARKRRERHHTRRWFQRQMLAVQEGTLVMSDKQFQALLALARSRGWLRPPSKR